MPDYVLLTLPAVKRLSPDNRKLALYFTADSLSSHVISLFCHYARKHAHDREGAFSEVACTHGNQLLFTLRLSSYILILFTFILCIYVCLFIYLLFIYLSYSVAFRFSCAVFPSVFLFLFFFSQSIHSQSLAILIYTHVYPWCQTHTHTHKVFVSFFIVRPVEKKEEITEEK